MKQTGLMIKAPTPTAYVMGGVSGITKKNINPNGDWSATLPTAERQYSRNYPFDTLSCTTFSAMNWLEDLLSYMIVKGLLSQSFNDFLKADGYLDENGRPNFSDRWIAIKSGTTARGNDPASVFDAIRHVGVIPEKMFPFGGKNFEEYHDKKNLTQAMEDQGKKWLSFADVLYEWVFFNPDISNVEISPLQRSLMIQALTESPLHLGAPVPATHAVMGYGMGPLSPLVFDTYEPFDVEDKVYTRTHFALKGAIIEKSRVPRTLRMGMDGDDVIVLQEKLNFVMGKTLIEDGDFGKKTNAKVIEFQKKYGLVADGVVGKLTRAMLDNKVAEKKTLNENPLKLLPLVDRMADELVDECSKAGMPIRIVSGLRTFDEQTKLFNQGRTAPGKIVTNARAGYSFHNYGIAIDIYAIKGSKYSEIAKIGKRIGFEWGGDFKTFVDLPHFEVKLGYKISDFLNKRVDFKKYD